MRNPLIRLPGVISVVLLTTLAGCRFPYGFHVGGLDKSLKTVAVLPLENKTTTAGLERELTDLLSADIRKQLGLREAPESKADVIVTGSISRYEVDIPVAMSANPTGGAGTRRKLLVAVDISIRNARNGRVLFQRVASGDGEYAEGAEVAGRRDAFVKVVNDIIQGVQSQW